jgi:hypothetical protein
MSIPFRFFKKFPKLLERNAPKEVKPDAIEQARMIIHWIVLGVAVSFDHWLRPDASVKQKAAPRTQSPLEMIIAVSSFIWLRRLVEPYPAQYG